MEFEILGQKIVITNPEEMELASFAVGIVHDKLDELKAAKPLLGPQQLAVLTLLHLAGEMVKDRRAMDEYRKQLDDRCSALMQEVSQVIAQKATIQQSV